MACGLVAGQILSTIVTHLATVAGKACSEFSRAYNISAATKSLPLTVILVIYFNTTKITWGTHLQVGFLLLFLFFLLFLLHLLLRRLLLVLLLTE